MNASFLRQPTRPLSRSTARNSALINQLATPGLGSLLAGRYASGIGQLLLALAGFGMVLGWFVLVLMQTYNDIEGQASSKSYAWLGEAGALTFVVSWLWALVTSLSLLREAGRKESETQSEMPSPPHLPPN
ncbi:MAG: hypothetical protein ACREIC_13155 [Limisphaerales bacterium]